MKKYIIIIIAMLFSLSIMAQRKTVTDKLQIPPLKNTEILSTDKEGNLIKGKPIKQKTAEEIYLETWTAKSTHTKIDFSTITNKDFDARPIVDNGVHYIAVSHFLDGAIINKSNHTIANTLIYLKRSNDYPKILLFDSQNLKVGAELLLIEGKYDISKTIIDASTRKPLINYSDKTKSWYISFVLKPSVKIDANNEKTEVAKAVNYVKNSLYYTSKGGQQATSIKQKIDAKLDKDIYKGTAAVLNENIEDNSRVIKQSINSVVIDGITGIDVGAIPPELSPFYHQVVYNLTYNVRNNNMDLRHEQVPFRFLRYIPKPVDWNETNAKLPTFIKNKPVIPNFKDSITIGEEAKVHTTIKPTGITFHAYSAFLRRNVKYTIKPTSAPIGLTGQEFTLPNIGGMLATEPSVANQLKGKLNSGTYTGTATTLNDSIKSNKKAIDKSIKKIVIDGGTIAEGEIPSIVSPFYISARQTLYYSSHKNDGTIDNQQASFYIPIYIPQLADWNQTSINHPSYIKNKPDISLKADKDYVDLQNSTKLDKGGYNGTAGNLKYEIDKARNLTPLVQGGVLTGIRRQLEIPNTVTAIANDALSGKNLSSVTIPNTVKTIGIRAFTSNNISSLTIPNSVTGIGDNSFSSNKLTSVTISNSVTNIGNYVFYNNKLTSVIIPNSVKTIGHSAFSMNQLSSVIIPNSVTKIGNQAFSDNRLTSVTLSTALVKIGDMAFFRNSINKIILPNSVTTIGQGAFQGSGLKEITFSNSVTNIESSTFSENQLTSVVIPNSVKTIGRAAFYKNQLTSITIPSSVTKIESFAFVENKLTVVTLPANCVYEKNSFDGAVRVQGGKLAQ